MANCCKLLGYCPRQLRQRVWAWLLLFEVRLTRRECTVQELCPMSISSNEFQSLTASDLMSRAVLVIPHEMSLRGAARLLSRTHLSGAPVVDCDGHCVGVLSTTDFMRFIE